MTHCAANVSYIMRVEGDMNVKRNPEAFSSHVMNVRGGFLLTHALSRYQYLMNQLWCKLQCITYHQVKNCLVRNAVFGRMCVRMEKK